MARKSSFDANSLVEGALSGIISQINDRAEREQEKIKIQRDILSYAVKEKIKNRMESGREKERMNWFEKMQGGMGGQRDFIKETSPMTGIADLFSKSGGRTGQVPYAMTEETETGERLPMMTQDIDYEGLGRAQTPTISSTGIGAKPMAGNDRMFAIYNGLKKIEESGRPLTPQQSYIKQGLERKLFGVGMEKKSLGQSERGIIGDIRAAKASGKSREDIEKYISYQGYEPEDFAQELEGYTEPQKQSSLESVKQALVNNPTIKTVSQAVNYLMQAYRVNKDKAIEMLKGMQEE